jgi:hypothetical protein
MEGQTMLSREITPAGYIPNGGDPGGIGGGTYNGSSNGDILAQWANIFGPAGADIKQDQARGKRIQRLHIPDNLKGHNIYMNDRIDGLISDATDSPFTTMILPYKWLDTPDSKIMWNVFSYDAGLASRVPYESAARVLTQTKRSYAAFAVRQGLGIRMEHNHMMSPAGIADFQRQVMQLVGSIQNTNDLDVHIAMIQAPSYQKEWNEKYHTTERTAAAVCRQYVDLFGMMQKNPNALDILIEEAKLNIRLWGGKDPSFLLCNQKLTFQLTMNPERTSFITQGYDGTKRLRDGPNLAKYRGLQIIHSRKYELEANTEPRDVMRRRVRVGEYYRVPPQTNDNWFVELYDESRDSWFKLTKNDLDNFSRIDGRRGDMFSSADFDQSSSMLETVFWDDVRANTAVHPTYPYKLTSNNAAGMFPDATEIIFPKFLGLSRALGWADTVRHVYNMDASVFKTNPVRREDWNQITESLTSNNHFHPRPNNIANMGTMANNVPVDPSQVPLWIFMNTAIMENTESFLWHQFSNVNKEIIRNEVIPFMVQNDAVAETQRDYDALCAGVDGKSPNTLNVYHSVMFLLPALRWHPVDSVREHIDALFTSCNIGARSLAASLTYFVRSCFRRTTEPVPKYRTQLGRRLDRVFKSTRIPKASPADSLFDRWPSQTRESEGFRSIMQQAGVPAATGCLDDFLIEKTYEENASTYTWNLLPQELREDSKMAFDEDNVIDSFAYAMLARNLFVDEGLAEVEFTPKYKHKKSKDQYEYVIVRPCIEHAMLGVVMGHGGEDLGGTFWGQTELSCYDDSFHGVWGTSYKYHSRAIVKNNKNLVRIFDISYDEYIGGKDSIAVDWSKEKAGEERPFYQAASNLTVPYAGPSLFVMRFKVNNRDFKPTWPSPIVVHDTLDVEPPPFAVDPDGLYTISDPTWRVFNDPAYREQYRNYLPMIPDFTYIHSMRKEPGYASVDSEASQSGLCFCGTYRICTVNNGIVQREEIMGNGHHGPDFVGVAPVRNGKGMRNTYGAPIATKIF